MKLFCLVQVLDLQKEMRGLILTNPSLMPEVDIKQPVSYSAVVDFIFDHANSDANPLEERARLLLGS